MLRTTAFFLFATLASAQYFPPQGVAWQKRPAADAGFDPKKLQAALAFALNHENTWDYAKDQERVFGRKLGSVPASRGAANVVIVRDGYLIAELGDTLRVEPVYSVAKSFLSTVAGLTVDRGKIRDVRDPVRALIRDGGYDSPHNSRVTWQHHLQQTSEWEGEMWGKRHDFVGRPEFGTAEQKPRDLTPPGEHYQYNDVRINRLSLSLLRLWREPLPDVLRRLVMDPIGASHDWKWLGYDNSAVEIEGHKIVSVPGGTRWGGGIHMHSRDLARFGLLFLNRGRWANRQILSEKWVSAAVTPGPVGPDYGYLWWLNTKGKQWPSAPRSSFAALGNGGNIIWVDPDHRLVVVLRWLANGTFDEFVRLLLASVVR
ncbi:MAG: serine hydrolase [Acidobacteria bacterium]|nr:serine hydrolase [Acidobacteriota bacterium]